MNVKEIPLFTSSNDSEMKRIKHKILNDRKSVTQKTKDRLDYLEFLKTANKFRNTDKTKAIKAYKRALWEQKTGLVNGLIYRTMRIFGL